MKQKHFTWVIGFCLSVFIFISDLFHFDVIEKFLIFAFFVIVPLTIQLVKDETEIGIKKNIYTFIQRFHFLFALFALLSLIVSNHQNEPNLLLAGVLSIGWLVYTMFMSLYGVLLIAEKGFSNLEEVAIGGGLVYFLMGGIWFTIYQFGWKVLDFTPMIIALTVIHFHYSSSIAPIFTGMLGRMMTKTNWYPSMVIVNLTAPLIIAFGISFSRTVELIGVVLFVISLIGYSLYILFALQRKLKRKIARVFLIISAISLIGTMGFALCYGIGRGFGIQIVSIPTMIIYHGTGNAVGFVFCGLIGWLLVSNHSKSVIHEIPFSNIYGRFSIGKEFVEKNQLEEKSTKSEGLIDNLTMYKSSFFDDERVDTDIRNFYEKTSLYSLTADIYWKGIFRYLIFLYKPFATNMHQINLPLNGTKDYPMESELLKIKEEKDGRKNPRAWIRLDKDTKKSIFVAVYSYHKHKEVVYNNIALPLLFGNMTGILCPKNDDQNGLIFTSSKTNPQDHSGIYYSSKWIRMRLPLNEYFHIYKEDTYLLAKHSMGLFGIPLLNIDYKISIKNN